MQEWALVQDQVLACLVSNMTLSKKERCDQKKWSCRGGAALCWASFLLTLTRSLSSQLTSCKTAQRAEKSILHQEVCTSLTINRRESDPLTPFFLSLSLAVFFPAPDYPCGPTQDLRTADAPFSLLFLSLALSPPLLCHGQSMAIIFYSVLKFSVRVGSLWKDVVAF